MNRFETFRKEKLQRIDTRMDQLIPHSDTEPVKLYQSVRYSLFAGAKRIRPILLLAIATSFRVNEDDLIDAACALEMVHTCSLILDDLPSMDRATMRRGQPTNHIVFGEDTAILAAFFLLNEAFRILANYRDKPYNPSLATQLIAILSRSIGSQGIIVGQFADLQTKEKTAQLHEIEFIHAHKTGALFTAAAEMAASFAKTRDAERQASITYARNIGLAFQIMDDVLDATSNANQLGKDTHKDAHKVTIVSVAGIDGARQRATRLVEDARAALSDLKTGTELLHDLADFVLHRKN